MSPVTPRRATPTDNTALLALAAACPMRARLTLCVRREPDFFALNRLQGERWDVGVVDGPAAGVIGCIATAVRLAYLNGATVPTAYVSDLKVHPDFRGRRNGSPGVADALTGYARDAVGAVDPAMAVLTTALAGNVAVARRLSGPRGLPLLSHVATIRLRSIPMLVLRRAHADAGVTVRRAQDRDLDEMAELWRTVACRAVPPRVQPRGAARGGAAAPCARHSAPVLERVSGLRPFRRTRRAARAPRDRGASARGLAPRLLQHRAGRP